MGKHNPRYAKRRWWRRFTPWRLIRMFMLVEQERRGKIELHVHYHFGGNRPPF